MQTLKTLKTLQFLLCHTRIFFTIRQFLSKFLQNKSGRVSVETGPPVWQRKRLHFLFDSDNQKRNFSSPISTFIPKENHFHPLTSVAEIRIRIIPCQPLHPVGRQGVKMSLHTKRKGGTVGGTPSHPRKSQSG